MTRIPHSIRGNKQQSYPRLCIYVDTETKQKPFQEDSIEQVFWFGYAEFRDYRNKKAPDGLLFEDIETFWGWVDTRTKPGERLYIVAHNQDFDFRILKGLSKLPEYGYWLKSLIWDSGRFIVQYTDQPPKKLRQSNPKKYPYKKHSKTLIFIDTLNFFKTSLEKLGETIGVEKYTIDFENDSYEKIQEYCRQDVRVLRTAFEHYIQFLESNDFGNFGLTIAKQSFNCYRHKFMNYELCVHTQQKAIDLERSAYFGGRVECFSIGKFNTEKYYKLDINSMYPFVMRDKTYPTKLEAHRYIIGKDNYDRLRKDYLCIAEVSFRSDINCFPLKRSNKLLFPIGHLRTSLCSPELDLLDKYKIPYKVHQAAFYSHKPIFTKFVSELYNVRMQFKKQGNKQYEQFTKIILNSLYGKFGQKTPEWTITEYGENKESWVRSIIDSETGQEYEAKCINGTLFQYQGEKEGYDSIVSIAAFVTSYARVLLWSMIETAGIDNCYYCDTDSLFVNKQGFDNLHCYIDDSKLGYLKLEDIAEEIEIYNVKDYVFNGEVKIKGVKKKSKRVSDYKFICEQWEHLNGALRKGRPETVIVKTMKKELKREYEKGSIAYNGLTLPYYILPN